MIPGVSSSQKSSTYVFFAGKQAPFLIGYRYTHGTGLSSKSSYAATSIDVGTGYIRGMDAHPRGSAIAYAGDDSPYMFAVSVTGTTSGAPTIGTRFSAPSTSPQGAGTNTGAAVTFAPRGDRLIYNSAVSPYVEMYRWSSLGFGTRYNNPGTLPSGGVTRARWDSSSSYIVVSNSVGSNYITAYANSEANGWGTKLGDPTTKPAAACSDSQFSPSGADVMVCSDATPFVFAYSWGGASGFGTKYANPATIPSTAADNGSWSPSGQTVLFMVATPVDYTYSFTSGAGLGFGAKKTSATNYPSSNSTGAAINHRGNAIAQTFTNTSIPVYVATYTDSSGVGTSITVPTGYAANYHLDTAWVEF